MIADGQKSKSLVQLKISQFSNKPSTLKNFHNFKNQMTDEYSEAFCSKNGSGNPALFLPAKHFFSLK